MVVTTVQIDLQKFRFTELGSNLAFVLKTIAHKFDKMQKTIYSHFMKQNLESTEGYSKSIVRWNKDKFGKDWSQQVEHMQVSKGRDQCPEE